MENFVFWKSKYPQSVVQIGNDFAPQIQISVIEALVIVVIDDVRLVLDVTHNIWVRRLIIFYIGFV